MNYITTLLIAYLVLATMTYAYVETHKVDCKTINRSNTNDT